MTLSITPHIHLPQMLRCGVINIGDKIMSMCWADNHYRIEKNSYDRSPETIGIFVKAFLEAFRDNYPEVKNFSVAFHNDYSKQPKIFSENLSVKWDAHTHWNSVKVITREREYDYRD